MEERYFQIKRAYDRYYQGLLASGQLPMRSTQKGFWAASISDEVFMLFQKLGLHNYGRFLDLGSGDGKVVLIASLFTEAHGIEHDEDLHEKAREMSHLGENVTLLNKDYLQHELSGYDAVFLHPDQRLQKLELKMHRELEGDLIVYGGDFAPATLQHIRTVYASSTPVALYRRP